MDTNLEEITKTPDTGEPTIVTPETEAAANEKVTVEEFKISGDVLVAKIKELVRQGNIRRICIKTKEGRTLIKIPMTVGAIGVILSAVVFPVITAVGVIGAMAAQLTIVIERQESGQSSDSDKD